MCIIGHELQLCKAQSIKDNNIEHHPIENNVCRFQTEPSHNCPDKTVAQCILTHCENALILIGCCYVYPLG